MRKAILIVLNVIVIGLIILELILLFKWINGSSNYEPIFTMVNGLLIPTLYYIKKRVAKKDIDNYKDENVTVINNYISVKEKTNEAELLLVIDSAKIIYIGQSGYYNMQINFRLGAKNKDIFISDVRIKCIDSVFGSGGAYGNGGLRLVRFFRKIEKDLLLLNDEDLNSFFLKEEEHAISTNALKIEKDSWYFYTIADFINSERLPDGYEDFSTNNWKIICEYNDKKKVEFDFKFDIHNSSPKYPVQWRYSGFN